MASFTSAQDFFVSNEQSKKFELIQKSHVPTALRFPCQGPAGYEKRKGLWGRECSGGRERDPGNEVVYSAAAISCTNSNWFEFVQRQIFANKHQLHGATCCSNLFPRHVAATCRLALKFGTH